MGRVRVLGIVAIQGLVAIVAAGALIVSVTSIQTSRERAAEDTCQLLRSLVFAATPPRHRALAVAFVDANGLGDCRTYARRITR